MRNNIIPKSRVFALIGTTASRRAFAAVFATCAFALSAACAQNTATPSATSPARTTSTRAAAGKPLRIIATNDVHGHLVAEPQPFAANARVGGVAELAAYIDRERSAFDGTTIVLDGGDIMQGTPLSNLVFGESTVDAFNQMGYSAAAIGNHEFDWKQDTLRARIAQAHYAWLAANITVTGTDTAPSWIKPTAIVRRGNLRIGIVGLSTQETPATTRPMNIVGLSFNDGAAALDKYIPILRRQNVDYVIVVAHSGASCDATFTNCHGEIVDWATRAHAKPDLIVAGHTHTVIQTVVNGVPIVEAGSYGNRYNVVDLAHVTRDSVSAHIWPLRTVFADSVTPNASVAAIVARYKKQIGPAVDRVIGTSTAAIPRGDGESPMGRLIADGQRFATNAQVAIMNTGGVRAALPAGPITWSNAYSVHPFGNTLVLMKLSGANLRAAIEHGIATRDVQAQVSGLLATYDTTRPPNARLLTLTLDDGTPIKDDQIYTVVVNDFLATGKGDGFTSLGNSVEQHDTGIVDLDALIAWIRHLGTVTPPTQPRLRAAGN